MTVEELANAVVDACELGDSAYMVTGAFAYNYFGLPRATTDVDVVLEISSAKTIPSVIDSLKPLIQFGEQVQFDTLTWGRRHIGRPVCDHLLSVELFELFGDEFVLSQFSRRQRLFSQQLNREIWIPTAEDIVVQKLRWARPKDLDDARDVLAVQGPETLDLPYIEKWCAAHGTTDRLRATLASLPEF